MIAAFYIAIVLVATGVGFVLGFEEGRAYEKEKRC